MLICCTVLAQTSSSPLPCPDQCFDTKKEAKKSCKDYLPIGCKVEKCDPDLDGSSGHACMEPTPVPTECPNVCSLDKKAVNKACKKLGFLGCTSQKCNTSSGKVGKTCSLPSSSCPKICYKKKKQAKVECSNLKALGCRVQTCMIDSNVGFECTDMTESTACPGQCFKKKKDAKRQCKDPRAQTLGCKVQACSIPGEKKAFSCGPVRLEDKDEIVLENPKIGQEFEFSLEFKNNRVTSKEDLYLLCDATGSMSEAISSAKSKFTELMNSRQKAETDAAFGIGFYRDEAEDASWGTTNGFKNLMSITKDTKAVQAEIDSLVAAGGGDGEEANLVALHKLATDDSIGWRDGARRIIVYFGDWPGHEPTCVDGLKITRETVINEATKSKISVIAVSFSGPGSPDGLNSKPLGYGCDDGSSGSAAVGQVDDITSGTGGDVVSSENQSELVSKIEELVLNLVLTYEEDTSDCDEFLNTVYTRGGVDAFPFSLMPDQYTTVIQKISLKPEVCSLPGDSFTCEFKYTASNAELPKFTVRTNGFSGC